jgi:hypothetical protein
MRLGGASRNLVAAWATIGSMMLAGSLWVAPATADDELADAIAKKIAHRYVGVRKCSSCHKKKLLGNQLKTWRDGHHQSAFETLENEQSQELAEELGLKLPAHQSPQCLGCHVTGYALPEEAFAYDLAIDDGVQCESCHGPGRDYRKKKIMSDPEVAAEKGLWDLSEGTQVCQGCHNPSSPTWDPARYTLEDGTTAGFHFQQAISRIAHPIPEETKGRYLEIEKKLKEQGLKVE